VLILWSLLALGSAVYRFYQGRDQVSEITYSKWGELTIREITQCSLCGAAIADEWEHTIWHNSLGIKGEK
jgi:hypothetical protein